MTSLYWYSYLTRIQATHSKSKPIEYKCLELQAYLKSENDLTIQEKCFVFQARSRYIPVKCNFKFGQSDLKCRQCYNEDETQEHIMTCPALEDNTISPTNTPDYNELFSDDVKKITIIARILKSKFKMLINNVPKPSAHTCSAALDNFVSSLSNDLD